MLRDRLSTLKAAAAERIPAATMSTMLRSRKAVESSGILDRTVRPGATMPDFSLADAHGQSVRLEQLRAHGPVLITLYRGVW